MITLLKGNTRGKTQTDWLLSYHSFSFGDYYDPAHIQFGPLRVINEDFVKANTGFGTHQHRDMEIITYIVDGELSHKDSMGNGSTIKSGEIQRMSAGTGVMHSEFNHSEKDVHLLQIWIIPAEKNLPPSYEQINIQKKMNEFIIIGSNHGGEGAVKIHQQVTLLAGYFDVGHSTTYTLSKKNAWLQVIKGSITVNGIVLQAGDGAAIENEPTLKLTCEQATECLLFDM